MSNATVTLKHLYHRGGGQIGLYFSYDTKSIEVGKGMVEWLGHANSKTTERYTHVAENNFKTLRIQLMISIYNN